VPRRSSARLRELVAGAPAFLAVGFEQPELGQGFEVAAGGVVGAPGEVGPFGSTRREVIERLGPPFRSGQPISDPVLGDYGAWDRFIRSGYVLHVEYRRHEDAINRLTLMRADVVPPG
jgi:hypothetical protein